MIAKGQTLKKVTVDLNTSTKPKQSLNGGDKMINMMEEMKKIQLKKNEK